jgi:putative lysine transport system substrate-binding protein
MKKKLVVSVLVGIMVLSTLTGCGKSSKTTGGAEATGVANATEATVKTGAGTDTTVDPAATSDAAGQKIFRIGIECTYPPYNWTQETEDLADGSKAVKIKNSDGYTYGYDVALAQKICDKLGWKLEVYKSDWTSIFMGLESKTYDCIMSGVCYTEERDKIYDFTSAYYLRQIKAVVREDGEFANVTKLSGFDGMNPKVIAQLGTNFVDYKS